VHCAFWTENINGKNGRVKRLTLPKFNIDAQDKQDYPDHPSELKRTKLGRSLALPMELQAFSSKLRQTRHDRTKGDFMGETPMPLSSGKIVSVQPKPSQLSNT
jgi:hypothetical protein